MVYQTEDLRTTIQLRLEGGTVWLTQAQIGELFQTTRKMTEMVREGSAAPVVEAEEGSVAPRLEEPGLPKYSDRTMLDAAATLELSLSGLTAFVLHDMFGMSFSEIARIVGRSPATARQLASRARRRVRGAGKAASADLRSQREVVSAFLAAARAGDLSALLAVLDPDVVRRVDLASLPAGVPREIRGASAVAKSALAGAQRGAAPPVALALVNGSVGVVVAPGGRLVTAVLFTVRRGKIREMDVVTDPARLRSLSLAVLKG